MSGVGHSRGLGVHLRQDVAQACQGTVVQSYAEAGLPASTSSLPCTTLHGGKAVPGRGLVEMLCGAS